MSAKNHIRQRNATMKLSIMEGSVYSVMVGFGQYFITPFAVFLGLPSFMIGFLRSFSHISSAIGFYLALWLFQFEKTRKEFISKYAVWQGYVLLFMIFLPLLPFDKSILLIVAYSLFMLFGSMISPIWTSLMRDVVIKETRASYFGNRNKIAGFFELSSSLIAGAILTFFTNNPLIGFGTIFFIAAISRFLSSKILLRHWDPNPKPIQSKFNLSLYSVKDKYLKNLIMLSGGMLFATHIAGAFFGVYMLRNLNFSYMDFTIATIASTLATLITQPYWGRLIDKYGTRAVLFSTSILIPFVPLLWIPAVDLSYVILIQLYAGVVWAGFDLAVFNMLLKISPRNQTAIYSATYNGIATFLIFIGSVVGSIIVYYTESMTIGLIEGLQIIFLISGVLRFLIVAYSLPRITRGMHVDTLSFFLRTVTVYPIKGIASEIEQGRMFIESFIISSSRFFFNPIGSMKKISKTISNISRIGRMKKTRKIK